MAHAELWKKRVEEWRASGLSAAEYCKGQTFTTSPLYRWSSRLSKEARGEAAVAGPLVRLVRGAERAGLVPGPAEVRARAVIVEVGGARVRVPQGADAATVRVVLEALGVAGRSAQR